MRHDNCGPTCLDPVHSKGRPTGIRTARRRLWRCPRCGAKGYEATSHAAYLAGTTHYEQEHDTPSDSNA